MHKINTLRILFYEAEEKIEFSLLMHEINVLTDWTVLII